METMTTSIEPSVVPRTANLLACKQWWRVCFLYGDQQKYYRQVYGKAAAQRLAATKKTVATKDDENDNLNSATNTRSSRTDRDYDIITDFIDAQLGELQPASRNDNSTTNKNNNHNETSRVTEQQEHNTVPLFPAKYQSTSSNNTASMTMRKSKKLLRSLKKHEHSKINKSNNENKEKYKESLELTKTNTRVTVLDDPFLFGIDEDHLGDLIRPKQYAINATEDISKYFSYYVDQQQHQVQFEPQLQQKQQEQPQEEQQQQQEQEQFKESLHDYQDDPISEQPTYNNNNMKPALPPKKKARPLYMETDLQLNQSDLEFLNLNLRKRGCFPRNEPQIENTVPHDISFTFNEDPALDSETSSKLLEQLSENIEELDLHQENDQIKAQSENDE